VKALHLWCVRTVVILTVVASALTSSANAGSKLWSTAGAALEDQVKQQTFSQAMADGDSTMLLALRTKLDAASRRRQFYQALSYYRSAIAVRPEQPEPRLRITQALIHAVINCYRDNVWCIGDKSVFREDVAREVASHFSVLRRIAKNDVRVIDLGNDMKTIFTRLNTDKDLTAAIELYREQLLLEPDDVENKSNLAEIMMMNNHLEEAIDQYRAVVATSGDTSSVLGLAVAMDRAGQRAGARRLISKLTADNIEYWENSIAEDRTFYVPDGEVYYYQALIAEVAGYPELARRLWNAYLASGAHPVFAPRVRENLKHLSSGARP
jgi:tetratricopeptide (TPR) repeat protein